MSAYNRDEHRIDVLREVARLLGYEGKVIAFWPCSTWDPDFVACLREHYTQPRGAAGEEARVARHRSRRAPRLRMGEPHRPIR